MKKWILIITAIFLLALIAAGFWTYKSFFYTTPLIQQELSDLTPDWTKVTQGNWSPWHTLPDGTKEWNPAASFNAWIATVPDQDKAWIEIADIFWSNQKYLINLEYAFFPQQNNRWEEHAEEFRTEKFQHIIDRTIDALNRPVMGCGLYTSTDPIEHDAFLRHGFNNDSWNPTPPHNPNLMELQLPYLGSHRTMINLLISGASIAIKDNRPEDFIEIATAAINSADLSIEYPDMISQFVRISVVSNSTQIIRWGLANHEGEFTLDQLEELEHALEPYKKIHQIWEGEALSTHDSFRRLAGPDGKLSISEQAKSMSGDGLPILGPPTHLPDSQLGSSIQRPLVIYNHIFRKETERKNTLWHLQSTTDTDEVDFEHGVVSVAVKNLLENRLSTTSLGSRYLRWVNQEVKATAAAIAVHKYRAIHGHFPESLTHLDYSDDAFLDEFTGKPLLYRLTDEGPIIYSTGDNRIDNGGNQRWTTKLVGELGNKVEIKSVSKPLWIDHNMVEGYQARAPDKIAGDWVLYPMMMDDPEPDFDEWED